MIKVSVIIPAYNIEKRVGSCIESIINQSLRGIQIIIINDGSTDTTLDVIKTYSLIDERIEVITTENEGVSAARNKGILASKGKYIYQIDGDDWLEVEGLEELYTFAEEENADITISNYYKDYKDETTTIIDGRKLTNDAIKDFLIGEIAHSVCTKFYRKDLFVQNNITYTEGLRIGEDLLINLKLLYHAKKVKKTKKTYLHYVKRTDSIMSSYKNEIKDLFIVFDEVQLFLKEKRVYTTYEKEFNYHKFRIIYSMGVLGSDKFGSIHKYLYERYINEESTYKENKYIQNFLKESSMIVKFKEVFYKKNYFLGVLFSKFIMNIRKSKILMYIINIVKKRLMKIKKRGT